jgi:MFS family permease
VVLAAAFLAGTVALAFNLASPDWAPAVAFYTLFLALMPACALISRFAVAAAGALVTLAPSVALVVAGLAAVCTAVFVSQSASTAFLRTAAPPRLRSSASGLYVSSYYLGGAAGGVAPALAWHAGGWRACVAMVVAVQLGTVALAHRAWRTAR